MESLTQGSQSLALGLVLTAAPQLVEDLLLMRKPNSKFMKLLIVVVAFISVFFLACSNPPPKAGPKFTGRVLLLNGDVANGANLSELTAAGDGYNLTPLVSGVFEAVASPDQTRLLYATKDEIMLRELRGGEAKSIIKGPSFCFAWAPDGNHFSYKQKSGDGWKIYAADLSGKTKMLWENPTETPDCGQWISPDRLVFDRFMGAIQKPAAGEKIKPNTTSVVTIGDSPKFRDAPKKWSIEAICTKGNVGFVRAMDQSQVLVAKNIDHFETIDPKPGPCSECRFAGFAAQSCVPFFIEQPTSTTTELFSLNPTNWQKQRPSSITWTFSPAAKMLIKSSARLMVAGDAPDKLLLIDTETGDVTPFFRKPDQFAIQNPAPVAWIEN